MAELKPEDIRPSEPETRIKDVEKAQAMAEAAPDKRSEAAFERQLSKILKQYEAKNLSKKELEDATKELMSLYPEDHEVPFSEFPDRHERLSKESDRTAEQLEYWAGVLHDHPQDDLSPQSMVLEENELNRLEDEVKGYHEFARKLPDLIKNGQLGLLNSTAGLEEFKRGSETKEIIEEYIHKKRELLQDLNTKVIDLVSLKQKLIEDCVGNEKFGYPSEISDRRELLESVKSGTYKKV